MTVHRSVSGVSGWQHSERWPGQSTGGQGDGQPATALCDKGIEQMSIKMWSILNLQCLYLGRMAMPNLVSVAVQFEMVVISDLCLCFISSGKAGAGKRADAAAEP